MKAFAFDELGRPGSLEDLPVPEPGEGQVRIRVAATSLNPFDNAVVQGYMRDRMEHRFPLILGLDASGTVDAVGLGASWEVGDEVFGAVGKAYLGEGTLAEFATMSSATVARRPNTLDRAASAAIPTAGVTALLMADAIAPTDGETVLAVGATGGVGSYFMQLVARRGARVVAVCSEPNGDYARRLGASDVIDYAAGDLADQIAARYADGIDAVGVMHAGADTVTRLGDQVGKGGRVASAVGGIDVEDLASRDIEGTNVVGRVATSSLEELADLIVAGEIVTPELRSFALGEAGDALASIATGHTRGKIVVTFG